MREWCVGTSSLLAYSWQMGVISYMWSPFNMGSTLQFAVISDLECVIQTGLICKK